MTEYQKIETLFKFDGEKKLYTNEFYNPIVEYLKDLPWIASEKFDGTNIRVHYDGHRVEWSGRTDKAVLPKEIEELLKSAFGESEVMFEQIFSDKDVILFMECYGGKVQGGIYGGKERLIGFDIMVNGIYLDKTAIKEIFDKFGVETVNFFIVENLDEAISIVKKESLASHNDGTTQTIMEGLVCVPLKRLYDAQGKRIAVKIKSRDLRKMAKEELK